MRINARLGADLAGKFEHLQARTGKSATEVLHAAIDVYFAQVVGPAGNHALLDDFVACAVGEAGLSEQYKQQLTQSLASKMLSERAVGRGPKAAARKKVERRRERSGGS